ncbi:MAG: SAM-dependent methyltransferase [Pyrinomonadaceae bacterium]
MSDNVQKFIAELTASIQDGTFVKLTLGNYKGPDKQLQKILVRLVRTKKGDRLYFQYRETLRDTAKNYDVNTGIALIAESLDGQFFSGHLFTTEKDVQLSISKKGRPLLNVSKPSFSKPPKSVHNREKKLQVDQHSFYLKALGITDDTGRVKNPQQDKWRQINKFIEVLASLVDKSQLKDKHELSIVDMGCGKGYLTFAAYDHFKNVRGVNVHVVGVETRPELVKLCNHIADASGFDNLKFVVGDISQFDMDRTDILIALHACNTATDDALFKGISAHADLIIGAPCCHQELRPQIKAPAMLKDILKHGVMLERTAETLTDGLRSLLLERSGYETKLFEFVSIEHTAKNNMLVGTRTAKKRGVKAIQRQIDDICEAYGIRRQALMSLLGEQQNLD